MPSCCVNIGMRRSEGTPQVRVLEVLRLIKYQGSISFSSMLDVLQLPRGSLYRALQALKRRGWIRKRLGDNEFVVSQEFCDLLGIRDLQFNLPQALLKFMRMVSSERGVHAELSRMAPDRKISTIESTCRKSYECAHLTPNICSVLQRLASTSQLKEDLLNKPASSVSERKSMICSLVRGGPVLAGDGVFLLCQFDEYETCFLYMWSKIPGKRGKMQLKKLVDEFSAS